VPSGITENVKATFTLEGKKVVAVSTQYFDAIGPSANYQKGFEGAYKGQVIGKDIDEVELFRVGGASLTSQAFNKAVGMVKVQLQSK
jgi:putative ABC transport system ATP-binding protein